MVRITAVKVNTDFFRMLFYWCLIIGALLLFLGKILPSIGTMVSNLDVRYFKKAIQSNIVAGDVIEEEPPVNVLEGINKGIETLTGFSIKNPQTLISYQLVFLKEYNPNMGSNQISGDLEGNDDTGDSRDKADAQQIGEEVAVPKETVINAKGITLINETNYSIDVDEFLNRKVKIPGDAYPQVLIYHTHTYESYTPSAKYKYVPSDTDRSNNPNYNMIRVGEELAQVLRKKYNVSVIHDKTIHDGDSYNRAYTKSQKTLEGYIKKYPKVGLIIDIHRDAANVGGNKLRAVTKIDRENSAQIMMVIGTDGRGMTHPYWRENLALGMRLSKKMNELNPGISKGINLKLGRFNQFLSKNAILMEVGANGSTLDEALRSTNYIARGIVEVLKSAK